MKEIDKLIKSARAMIQSEREARIDAVYNRMSLEQLRELAYDEPNEERIREIFASVDGLWVLEEGG